MEKNQILVLVIGIILIFVVMIIYINFLSKTESSKKLSINELYDYITDLSIDFGSTNIEKYTPQQIVVVSIWDYSNEVNNGGLCQFFVNSSRNFAPILSESLEKIGAKKNKAHFDNFVKKNKIDVNDLTSFISKTKDEFIAQYDRYPFESFDHEFYDLEKEERLDDLLIKYIYDNYDQIVTSN